MNASMLLWRGRSRWHELESRKNRPHAGCWPDLVKDSPEKTVCVAEITVRAGPHRWSSLHVLRTSDGALEQVDSIRISVMSS